METTPDSDQKFEEMFENITFEFIRTKYSVPPPEVDSDEYRTAVRSAASAVKEHICKNIDYLITFHEQLRNNSRTIVVDPKAEPHKTLVKRSDCWSTCAACWNSSEPSFSKKLMLLTLSVFAHKPPAPKFDALMVPHHAASPLSFSRGAAAAFLDDKRRQGFRPATVSEILHLTPHFTTPLPRDTMASYHWEQCFVKLPGCVMACQHHHRLYQAIIRINQGNLDFYLLEDETKEKTKEELLTPYEVSFLVKPIP